MAELKRHHAAIRALGGRLYALSVDEPRISRLLAAREGLPFDLLCDPQREVVRLYGLYHEHRGGIAYPAAFILTPDGRVAFRALEEKSRRTPVEDIAAFLRTLQTQPTSQARGRRLKWVFPSIKTYLRDKGLLPDPYHRKKGQ